MHRAFIVLVSTISIVLGAAVAVQAQSASEVDGNLDALFGDHVPYKTFFDRLKKAVGAGDKAHRRGPAALPRSACNEPHAEQQRGDHVSARPERG